MLDCLKNSPWNSTWPTERIYSSLNSGGCRAPLVQDSQTRSSSHCAVSACSLTSPDLPQHTPYCRGAHHWAQASTPPWHRQEWPARRYLPHRSTVVLHWLDPCSPQPPCVPSESGTPAFLGSKWFFLSLGVRWPPGRSAERVSLLTDWTWFQCEGDWGSQWTGPGCQRGDMCCPTQGISIQVRNLTGSHQIIWWKRLKFSLFTDNLEHL